ncbi:TPA: hypothetical protein ACU9T0_006116 [Burkholderia cenocepacia]|uniref:hypothetical protein n=1 Tax=Burkholderia cenocepacia TaxID=95486 RepID=UPI002AB5F2BE|nr:hypothetical protein [Burkholderia cenocepacia]
MKMARGQQSPFLFWKILRKLRVLSGCLDKEACNGYIFLLDSRLPQPAGALVRARRSNPIFVCP